MFPDGGGANLGGSLIIRAADRCLARVRLVWPSLFLHAQGTQAEAGGLAEEGGGVVVEDLEEGLEVVAAAAGFKVGAVGLEGSGDAPIGGGIHAELRGPVHLDHVHRPLRRTFGNRVNRHAGPIPRILHQLDGVLFHVINKDTTRIQRTAKIL